MHIFSEGLIRNIALVLLAVIPLSVLLIPIVIVTLVQTLSVRLGVVFVANALFVMVLAVLARPRMGELFVAGST